MHSNLIKTLGSLAAVLIALVGFLMIIKGKATAEDHKKPNSKGVMIERIGL